MKEFSLGGNGFDINEISQFIESLLSERKVESLARDHERGDKRKHSDWSKSYCYLMFIIWNIFNIDR